MKTIWCMRNEKCYFKLARIESESWLIILFGYAFWVGPDRPSWLNEKNR